MGLEAVNLALAAYMTGVIWVVQVVLYPSFALVGEAGWAAYHAAHSRRITPVVAPVMLAHPLVALALLAERPGALAAVNLALAGGLLLVTATCGATRRAPSPGRRTPVSRSRSCSAPEPRPPDGPPARRAARAP
jgi:hypothetical protein